MSDSAVGAATAGEHAGVRFPPPLIFLIGLGAGIGLDAAIGSDLPAAVQIAGAAIGVAGFLVLDSSALRVFHRAGTRPEPWKPSSELVVSGPYRFTRNPMYVGMASLFAGLAFAFDAPWALLVLPVVLLVIDRYVIAREEPYLERTFGADYLAYKRKVRRWL